MAVPGQQRLLDTSSPGCPHPMVIKAPWGRGEPMHDGGEVQKMLRFEDQSLTEEQKGGNPQSSAGAGACERETAASVLGGFSLRGGGNIWLQITCWAEGVSHLHKGWHRVTRVTGASLLLLGRFSQLPQAWGFRRLIPHFWGGGRRKGFTYFPIPGKHGGEGGLIFPSFQETHTVYASLFEERKLLSAQPRSCPRRRRMGHGLGAIHFLQMCPEIACKAPPAAPSAFSQWKPTQAGPVQGGEGVCNSIP